MNNNDLSNEEILRLYREFCKGGKDARRFFDKFNGWLIRYVKQSFHKLSYSEIQDRIQEVWIKLYKFCGREKNETKFIGLLKEMSKNIVLDYYKSAPKRTGIMGAGKNQIDEVEFDAQYLESKPNPGVEDEALANELFEVFHRAFRQLPDQQRRALHLKLCQGYSDKEIAKITDSEYEAVRARIRAGTNTLKKAIKTWQEGKK